MTTHARRPARATSVGLSVLALSLGALSLGACGTETRAQTPHAATFDLHDDPAADIAPVDATRTAVLPAADLHALLDSLLSEHSALAVHLMRAATDGTPGDRAAVTKALAQNTDSLTGAIGIVYGPDGARAFDQLWKQHIQFFADYAAARSDAARTEALADLRDYSMDFSSFTATATGGLAPLEAVVGLLHTHITQLTAAADAYRRKDYAGAVRHQHEARSHMYDIAGALAGAISTQQPAVFPGDAAAGAARAEVTKARTEAVQLHLDRSWSAAYRPKLVPSIDAEIARLNASPSLAPAALPLRDGPDPEQATDACDGDVRRGALDSAMACGHDALAAAAT